MTKQLSINSENTAISYFGYSFEPSSHKWQLSRDNQIYLSWVDNFLVEKLKHSFLKVLQYYAENYSPAHTNSLSDRFREFARFIKAYRGIIDKISSSDLMNYRATLNREHEWYLGTLRGFFKTWLNLGYEGIEGDVQDLLNNWRLKGNIKGKSVQTLCPKEGPLSDLEFEALHESLINTFERGDIELDSFVLVQLFIATGRRPAQLGDLKNKDLIEVQSKEGLKEFFLNVPRRKQRAKKWREEFKTFALVPEIGKLVKKLIEKNNLHLHAIIDKPVVNCEEELPMFPDWEMLQKTILSQQALNLSALFKTQSYHKTTRKLSLRLKKVINSLMILSERTGKILNILPTRLRRTLATRAAREGFGELIIAELLDHTDTQNARVYTENVPEHVDAINQAVARQLAPLAQAFAGMVVEKESDARRGNDIASRVRSVNGNNIGTCGHYGFCGALAPIACYTCRNFQPWVDGPHEEVLNSLIADRERVLQITKDKIMAYVNDRTIIAVTQVIQICERRRSEVNSEVCHG